MKINITQKVVNFVFGHHVRHFDVGAVEVPEELGNALIEAGKAEAVAKGKGKTHSDDNERVMS